MRKKKEVDAILDIEKLSTEDMLGELVSFMGYGISKMIKVSKRIKNNVKKRDLHLLVYRSLRQLKHELPTENMYKMQTNAYFQMKNLGYLAIPNPALHDWGYYLLSIIRNVKSIEKYGNRSIEMLKNVIKNDKKLFELFTTMWNTIFSNNDKYSDVINNQALKSEVFRELTNKVCHSRVQVFVKYFINTNMSRSKNRDNSKDSTRRANLKEVVGIKRKKTS